MSCGLAFSCAPCVAPPPRPSSALCLRGRRAATHAPTRRARAPRAALPSSPVGGRVPLDVEVAAFRIAGCGGGAAGHFVCGRTFGLIDAGSAATRATFVASLRGGARGRGVGARLARALADAGVAHGAGAMLAEFGDGVLRVASAGLVGLCVVREREVVFRSYVEGSAEGALEEAFRRDAWGGERGEVQVESEFFEMEEGDLLLAGSPELFSNLSEEQMLSFVRPVPDSYDATLAIANGTCLGSFRTDDVEFISYYVAHLAYNFATSSNAKQLSSFPFPPGTDGEPYFRGDMTVIAASCTFAL